MITIDALWSWLIRAAVLSSLILLVGELALRFVRQPAERLRLIQWVLIACLVSPFLPVSSVWQIVSVNLIGRAQSAAQRTSRVERSAAILTEPTSTTDTSPTQPAPNQVASRSEIEARGATLAAAPRPRSAEQERQTLPMQDVARSLPLREVIVGAWALAITILALRNMVGIWIRFSLQRRGRAPSRSLVLSFEQIAGPAGNRVRLVVSDAVDGLMTWGALRPLIVVPENLANRPNCRELRCGLAHEWSHVKKGDMASLWLALAAQLVCFYQPLYWMQRRRMFLCQDYIADAFAAGYVDSAEDYATVLLCLAKSRLQPASSLALGIADGKSQLSHRVRMLVDSPLVIRPNCRKCFAVLSACSALIGMSLLTTIDLDAREPQDRPYDNITASTDNAVESAAQSVTTNEAANEANPEAGVISGVLLDVADGQPVANAHVILRSGGILTTETDEAGKFRFENIKDYSRGYELWAYRDNLITEKAMVNQVESATGAMNEFEPLRLEMRPGHKVHFVVKSKQTGLPVPKAEVRFGYPDRRKVLTDEQGEATVSGLLQAQYDVTVEAQGYARDASQIDPSHGGAVTPHTVSLAPGGEFHGVVVDEQGQPVAGADVVYREPGGIGFYGDSFRTNSRGEFSHRYLPLNAPLGLSVDKQDFLPSNQDISLTDSQRVRNVRVVLQRRPAGGSVAGVVRDQNGKPLAGAQVANYGNRSSQERVTTTDADGRFALDDLFEVSGRVDIRVSAEGFAPERVPVKPGTRQEPAEVSVTLKPGHAVRGRIENEAGNPVSGAYVMARSSIFHMGMESVRSNNQGEFAFDSLPADVRFQISHPHYANSSAMTLHLDGPEPVTVTLEEPGQIRGQVLNAATKQPLEQFNIRLGFSRDHRPGDATGTYNVSWGNPGLMFQDAAGRFKIEPLVADMPLELTIEADGYERMVVPRAVAEKPESAEDLSIALSPRTQRDPYALTVQLLSDAGQPLAGVQLRLIVSTNQPTGYNDNAFNWVLIDSGQLGDKSYVEQFLPGVTDEQGRCEFTDILPGKYLQLAYWGEGIPKGRSLAFDETRSGEADNVDIAVPRPAIVRGTVDRSQFPDVGGVRISGDAGGFLNFETKLAADQSAFELRDVPPGEYWISVDSKPQAFTENGFEMFRISPLASQRLNLKPGDETTVRFNTPDEQR